MRKIFFVFWLYFIYALHLSAQHNTEHFIMGQVEDNITLEALMEAHVALLRADSSVVDSTSTMRSENTYNGMSKVVSTFIFRRKLIPAKYILRVEKQGYDVKYIPINFTKLRKRETFHSLPVVRMQRTKVNNVGEITVTTTKVKFYHKGDTLVYNADAFQMQEGSMLDALIKQLPGTELKSDGRIFVNGRFVENLMLNGKDFFKGNNKIMLDNLPTYVVNNIKVYERESDKNRFLGLGLDNKTFVMDVNLKKQYSIGWLGNADGGSGTAETFLAQMLAMRFTTNSRIAMFGNVNNVNNNDKPHQGSDWTPEKMPLGRQKVYKVGVDVNISDRNEKFKFVNRSLFNLLDNKITANTFRTNFFMTGDTYDCVMKKNEAKDLTFSTYNNIVLTPTRDFFKMHINVSQTLNYVKHDNDMNNFSITSNYDWGTCGKATIDSLYNPTITPNLRKILINRNLSKSKGRHTDLNGELAAEVTTKMPHSPDLVSISANISARNIRKEMFDNQRIEYIKRELLSTQFLNNYTNSDPTRSYKYNFSGVYTYLPNNKWQFDFGYIYEQSYQKESRNLYQLAELDGWNDENVHGLGTLPSEEQYLQTIDKQNSYNCQTLDRTHIPYIRVNWNIFKGKSSYAVSHFRIQLPIHNQKLIYKGANSDTTFTRRSMQIRVHESNTCWMTNDMKHMIDLSYGISPQTPNLRYFVRATDDADPLNVTRGGNRLKDILYYYTNLRYNYRGSMMVSPNVYYNRTNNAVSMGYFYDKATGRRTITPASINGNWRAGAGLSVSGALDKKRNLMFSNDINADFNNSADFICTDDESPMGKSIVKTWNTTERMRLDYKLGKHSIGFSGTLSWLRSTSDMATFSPINAYNYNYGLTVLAVLPGGVNISTDITMYSRRGYADEAMNDNNLVWNARATKSVIKGHLTLAVDAFDILHQLRKVDRYVNAQGRVETYYNTVPRYMMFHAIYKFNVMPKKK